LRRAGLPWPWSASSQLYYDESSDMISGIC
jgi:hypothetical protein